MHLKSISCRVFTTRWFMPVFTVALGVALGGAQWIGGDRERQGGRVATRLDSVDRLAADLHLQRQLALREPVCGP